MFGKNKKMEEKSEFIAIVGDAMGDIATGTVEEREHGVRMLLYLIHTKSPDAEMTNWLLAVALRFARRLDPQQFPDDVLERLVEEERQEASKRQS